MRIFWCILIVVIVWDIKAADYYWVGGSGNWSDISHWAAVSGGSVKYPSAPTSEDNVIFDANSFTGPNQAVVFQNDIVFLRSMDWTSVTNMPRLVGPKGTTVNVFGDLLLSPDMVLDVQGKILFTGGREEKRIDLAGHVLRGVMTFDGESTWTMESAVAVDSMIEISRGEVLFNAFDVACRFLHFNTSNEKRVDLRNSTILISGAYQEVYENNGDGSVSLYIQNAGLTLQAEGSTLELSAPNASFYHLGPNDNIFLEQVLFSASTGQVYMTSEWFEEVVHIGKLTFNSNALVEGRVDADTISFVAGGRYRFGAEKKYNFNTINAMGDCAEGVVITSDNPGYESVFNIASGVVNMEFITLRDIHAEGGAILDLEHGVDLGNNEGWNFINSAPLDFYWIGGTGMWTDPAHWSFSSGGLSSGCVPSGKDDAYFDANSFSGPNQSVSLASNATYIHDLTWDGVSGNPEFEGKPLQRIVLTGSLQLAVDMEHDIEGSYDFESEDEDKTLRMNGNIFNESISFSGLSGQWRFLDDVEVYRTVYFRSGHLILDGHQLTTTRFSSMSSEDRLFDISASTVLLRESLYLGPEWNVDLENYQVIANNSTIEFTENGNFDHNGSGYGLLPSYDKVIMNNSNSGIRSVNNATDESQAAIFIDDLSFSARGRLLGSNHIATLRLADGFSYVFDSGYNRSQVIDNLLSQGSCSEGLTQLFGSEPGNQANISLMGTQTLERMNIQDINVIQGALVNNNSVDGGNNGNMTFNDLVSRTLYWVGNSGEWQDPSHWSLSSGGVGGECIPTGIDDVVFDINSFTVDDQRVTSVVSSIPSCNDFTFLNTLGNPMIAMDFLLINGSLNYDASFRNDINEHIFSGRDDASVFMGSQEISNVRFRKQGRTSFLDDFVFSRWIHEMGAVDFGSNSVAGLRMYFYGGAEKELNLQESKISLSDGGDAFNDRSSNLTVIPGRSKLLLTAENVGVFSRNQLEFNQIIFENTQGSGYLASRHIWESNDLDGRMGVASIFFNGGGKTYGHVSSDTLVGVAGKIYELDGERTIDVSSLLQLRGNNCTPIELRSSSNAQKAIVTMPPTSEIVVDFVQMKNIEARGGAIFNAGSRSVDVGNSNIGWIFQDAQDFIESGFLGVDRAICDNEPLELNANSYSSKETYLWSTGSVSSSIVVEEEGQYFVEVEFESNCVLKDTIEIIGSAMLDPNLPDMEYICGDEPAILNAEVDYDGATYSWSTGTSSPILEVESPGRYFVDVAALGCVSKDSVIVDLVEDPGRFLPLDTMKCQGSQISFSPSLESPQYMWSDGSSGEVFEGDLGGNVWLDILIETCLFRDSIFIAEIPIPDVDLGRDTSICDNSELQISLEHDYNYQWQDGSNASEYRITMAGQYILEARDNGCVNTDTLEVGILTSPLFSLGEDMEVCASETVVLQVPNGYSNYKWNDGSADSSIVVVETGRYHLELEDGGCFARDTIEVYFIPLPEIHLGADTTVCEDEAYTVIPIERSGGDIAWHDGSAEDSYEVRSPGLISATVFDGLCENSDSLYIDFKECTYFDMYIPTAFSPNGDGYNDVFKVFVPQKLIVNSYSISIFDRWGSKVFESADVREGWDGNVGAKGMKMGVYVYVLQIEYTDENGRGEQQVRGDFLVVN